MGKKKTLSPIFPILIWATTQTQNILCRYTRKPEHSIAVTFTFFCSQSFTVRHIHELHIELQRPSSKTNHKLVHTNQFRFYTQTSELCFTAKDQSFDNFLHEIFFLLKLNHTIRSFYHSRNMPGHLISGEF